MTLAFKIALRFLKSGKSQTILIALGISIGVAVQIFIGSLIQGLQSSLIEKTVGDSPQITITSSSDDKAIRSWKRAEYEASISDPGIRNISPAADSSAFIEWEDGSEPVLVRGFDISRADNIYRIKSRVYDGVYPAKKNEMLVGRDLSRKIGAGVGDKLYIFTPAGVAVRMTVTGLYDLDVAAINKSWLITDIGTSQEIFGLDSKITSIEMQVVDVFAADSIARKVKYSLTDPSLEVVNWKDQNKQLLSGLNGQSVSSYMIQIFVLIAVLLGISSVLAISVVQKSKQLGILKAMGIKDRDASLIFVFQGLLLGVIGAAFGAMFGIGLLAVFSKFAQNPDGTPIVPVYVDSSFIAASAAFAVMSAMAASIIPARLSSKLSPIEVIRNG